MKRGNACEAWGAKTKSAPLYALTVGYEVRLIGPVQPVPPLSLELVPEHWGVQSAVFVTKPEQLPEDNFECCKDGT